VLAATTSIATLIRPAPGLVLGFRQNPLLEQRRVEVDHVRHHRRAEDPDRQQDRLATCELRQEGVLADGAQRWLRVEELAQVANADHAHDRCDHGLEGPEAEALQAEDRNGGDAGEQRCRKERDAEQEVEAERSAQELREVGRHRDQLGLDPEGD
jgi:hypothetical protein